MKNTIINPMGKAAILLNYMEADLWFYNIARPRVARTQEHRHLPDRRKAVPRMAADRENVGERRKANRRRSTNSV